MPRPLRQGIRCVRKQHYIPRDSIDALHGAAGITGNKPVIAYCRIGERSSHSWFVLHYLMGLDNVTNYDGSWTEWGNLVGAAVERSASA